jgi:hypothetical protein
MKLRLTPAMLRQPSRPERRLPGEKHEFKEAAPGGVRNLTPPQTLGPDGTITSSRPHEVTKTDPLLARIRELEAEIAALRNQLETTDDND